VAIVAPLLWRRRHPVPVAVAVLAAVALQSAVLRPDAFPAGDALALICAAYAAGAYAGRRAAVAGLVVLALGEALHALAFHPEAVAIAVLGAGAVPWTVGRIVRAQRQLLREARERAAQAERIRAHEARAAVNAERMRVARELHDAVAHSISVIAIQAAGADGVLERDPARAAQCATLIEAVGREAIAELGRIAGHPAGGRDASALEPSLARVDALAQRARDGGLPVDVRVEGEPARLAAGIDLAAFRIVQEALANVSKHAGAARAWVVVRYDERAVELEIGDDGTGRAARTTRFRLGMRTIVAEAGDSVVVPAGRVHKFSNAGDGPARARVEVVPALDMEELLCTTAELAREGHVLPSGMPRPLHLALFVERFRREVRAPFPPAWAVRGLMALLAAMGRRRGLADRYAIGRPAFA
jgi:signal transduction histidine kinase